MRIVSLLPSATEIICALGLREQLVGATYECDFPPSVANLPKVTRTLIPTDVSSRSIDAMVRDRLKTARALYTLDMPTLQRLRPELIVTQALCDVCAVAETEVQAAARSLPGRPRVVNLEPTTLAEVIDCLRQVAQAAQVVERGDEVIARLQTRVQSVARRSECLPRRRRTTILEWIDPLFCCGHWSPEIVNTAGGVEGIGRAGERSRTILWQDVLDWRPETLVVACCGFSVERTLADLPLLRSQPGWAELPCVIDGDVFVVDGAAYFSRPGPRLVDSLEILASALHPELHPLPRGLPAARRVAG